MVEVSQNEENVRYASIPIEQVPSGTTLDVDIYIHLRENNKIIRYKRKGDNIDDEKLKLLKGKGVIDVLVREGELKSFRLQLSHRIFQVASDESSSQEQKKEKLATYANGLMDEFFNTEREGKDEELQKHTREVALNVLKMSIPKKISGIYEKLCEMAASLGGRNHSTNVSSFATMFAMSCKVLDSKALMVLGSAGMFHDVGLNAFPKDLVNRYRMGGEVTSHERSTLQEHAYKGVLVLRYRLPDFPEDVRKIIHQHHEYFDGSGYPKALSGVTIHPLARLLCIANDFENKLYFARQIDPRTPPSRIILDMQRENSFDPKKSQKYDPKMLGLLVKALGIEAKPRKKMNVHRIPGAIILN